MAFDAGTISSVLELRDEMSAKLRTATAALAANETALRNVTAAAAQVGGAFTAGVTVPIVAGTAAVLASGIEFESSFAGVEKTVDATAEEFEALEAGLRKLATEMPISVVEINKVGEAAGQLGVDAEHIVDFTETMSILGITTNLSADQAATALARFTAVTGSSEQDVDKLAATLVELGNNFAATEAEIVAFALLIAGAGAQIGLTEADILGMSAALAEVGIKAEAGGTAISRVMIDIANAVASGGDALDEFARIAGLSVDDFVTAFETDPMTAITAFVAGLGTLDDAGENTFQVLDDLEQGNIRVRDALLRLSSATGLAEDATNTAAAAYVSGTAHLVEYEKRVSTTESQIVILKGKLNDIAIELFTSFEPAIKAGTDVLTTSLVPALMSAAQRFTELPPAVQMAVGAVAGMGAAFGPALLAFSALGFALTGITQLMTGLGPVVVALGNTVPVLTARLVLLEAGFTGTAIAAGALRIAIGGIVVAAAAIAVSKLVTEMKLLKDAIDETEQSTQGYALVQQNALTAASQIAGREITDLSEAYRINEAEIVRLRQSTEGAMVATIDMTAQWEFADGVLRKVEPDIKKVTDETGDLADATDDAATATATALPILSGMGPFAVSTAVGIQALVDNTRSAAMELPSMATETVLASTAIDGLSTSGVTATTATSGLLDQIRDAPSLLSTMGASLTAVFAGIPDLIVSSLTGGGGLLGAFSAIGSQAGTAITTSIGTSIGGTAATIINPLGALVVPLINGLIDLFNTDNTRQHIEGTLSAWGVPMSDGLVDAIEQTAKDLDVKPITASLLHMGDAFDTIGGIATVELGTALVAMEDLIRGVDAGLISLNDAQTVWDQVFAQGLPNAVNTGTGAVDQHFTDLLLLAEKVGIDTEQIWRDTFELALPAAVGAGTDDAIDDLNDLIAKAQEGATDVSGIIGDIFTDTLAAGIDAGTGLASAAVVDMVAAYEDMEIEVEEIKTFILDQADQGAQGLSALLTSNIALTEEQIQASAAAALGFYGEMVEQGQSTTDILRGSLGQVFVDLGARIDDLTLQAQDDALADAFGAWGLAIDDVGVDMAELVRDAATAFVDIHGDAVDMTDRLKALAMGQIFLDLGADIDTIPPRLVGVALSAADAFGDIEDVYLPPLVQSLIDAAEAIRDPFLGSVIDGATGAGDALVALHNLDILDEATFTTLASTITTAFDTLVERGVDADAAMFALQRPLEQLILLQEEHGWEVDDSTQALIDQAKEMGFVGDKGEDMGQRIVDALEEIIDLLTLTLQPALDDLYQGGTVPIDIAVSDPNNLLPFVTGSTALSAAVSGQFAPVGLTSSVGAASASQSALIAEIQGLRADQQSTTATLISAVRAAAEG